ncbi:MAG: NAD-dependent epimerase/dehydratase family protein [Actinobacteria bacterium]|nr:MAG: NAD-dependent epimerase/dehydratase family protein [Actinomycetota bacterium]
MRILVTGAAGFIGSSLCQRLLSLGHTVTGLDCLTNYYSRAIKQGNIEACLLSDRFTFVEEDLLRADLAELLADVDAVFHEAAQPGVRGSWGQQFEVYTDNNVLATQRLLEACLHSSVSRFVNASSSSVYGNSPKVPTDEGSPTRPYSPYGVTKLAAEHLCSLYWQNHRLPAVSLRYFTVYGPRQRPDMAMNRFITRILRGEEISLYGDGMQERDFTYIDDAVDANISAMTSEGAIGRVFNIGGGSRVTVNQVLEILESTVGKRVRVVRSERQAGDVDRTAADTTLARELLDYRPSVPLEEGLPRQVAWHREQSGR